MRALENSRALEKSLETTASRTFNSFNEMLGRGGQDFETLSTSNVSKKAAVSQNQWALGKRQELEAELKKQKMELADSNADALIVPGMAADYGVQGLQLAPAQEPALSQTQSVQTGRKEWNWRFNKAPGKEEAPLSVPPAEPKAAAKKRLYLNDNVVLRQEEGPAQEKAVAKGGEDASKLGDEQQWKALQFGRKQPQSAAAESESARRKESKEESYAVAGKPSEARAKADMAEKDQKASVLNTARGNIVAQQEAKTENVSTANSSQLSPLALSESQTRAHALWQLDSAWSAGSSPAAPGAAANASNAGQVAGGFNGPAPTANELAQTMRDRLSGTGSLEWNGQAGIVNQQLVPGSARVPGLTADAPQSLPAAANTAADGDAFVSAMRPARPLLQPEGRFSLAIEFPTEGEVLHFKKVKGNAALELTLVKPGAYDRRLKFGAFVLLAGLLWSLQKWAGQRRLRRLSGGPPGAVQVV
jgi:hypothetical protein